jgi:uncharacterized membrane protein
MNDILLVIVASASPISELRGGIPLGIGLGLEPALTFVVSVVTNILIFFPARFVLDVFYRSVLHRLPLFDRYLVRVREKGKPRVDKYGLVGLALFVAVPLPITGAYTGTVLSWLLAMSWRRAFAGVAAGVVIAGIIVMLVTLGVVATLPLLTN